MKRRAVPGIVSTGSLDTAGAISIDLRDRSVGMEEVRATLDVLASDLRSLWSAALERGEFDEVTRLVEVSHAVHIAVIALETDGSSLIGKTAPSP